MSKQVKRIVALVVVVLAVVGSPQLAGDSTQPLPAAAWLQTNDPGGGGGGCGGCGG